MFLSLNIFILIVLISSLIFVRDSRKRWNKVSDYLGDVTKTVDSVRYGNLTKKINKLDILDSHDLTESLNRMIETLKDREVMIDEFQKDLIKQNKILEQTVNSLSDGLMIVNENGEIYRANEKVTQWFEKNGKSLLGKSLYDYIEIPYPKSISHFNNDEIVIPTKRSSNFSASSVELNLEDKKERYMVIIRNITDQKELETLKEDFVATLTHDLKVPIIAETNMIDLFLNEKFGPINEKQKVALQNMQISNKELLELVQTVLETYKIGKISLYKENISLKNFINDIIEEMNPIAEKTKNKLDFILTRDICVYADKFQLKRVLKNLIQNAISYGRPKTPIEIKISEIPGYTVIKVKDHGEGISKENIDRIFNKYYSAARKFRKIGTGLGLFLALQIIKAHKGDLTVESEEGEFTEFCIKLPINYEQYSLPY
ncbi:PAS domain-containing protein [bacterium]|nr:PAS domain-containing protein [bacterium]